MKLLQDLYDEYFGQNFDRLRDFKKWYLDVMRERYSCIHFSIQNEGLDPFVKDWKFINQMPDKFGPTKSLIKKNAKVNNVKKTESKQNNAPGFIMPFLKFKKK